jgi:hypothetical protein
LEASPPDAAVLEEDDGVVLDEGAGVELDDELALALLDDFVELFDPQPAIAATQTAARVATRRLPLTARMLPVRRRDR